MLAASQFDLVGSALVGLGFELAACELVGWLRVWVGWLPTCWLGWDFIWLLARMLVGPGFKLAACQHNGWVMV